SGRKARDARNGLGGLRVVAREDEDADSRGPAALDGLLDARAERVADADEPERGQIAGILGGAATAGDEQDAEPAGRELARAVEQPAAVGVVRFPLGAPLADARAARNELLGRPLDDEAATRDRR